MQIGVRENPRSTQLMNRPPFDHLSVRQLPALVHGHSLTHLLSIIGAFGIGDAWNYPLNVLADLTQFLLDYNLTI